MFKLDIRMLFSVGDMPVLFFKLTCHPLVFFPKKYKSVSISFSGTLVLFNCSGDQKTYRYFFQLMYKHFNS
jgi:hypothetical protein